MKKIYSYLSILLFVGLLSSFDSNYTVDNLPDLKAKAKSENKKIVIYFCGSDWS